jgi:hypothetical protein
MKTGDTVYTVNAKTNEVDTWTYAGTMRADGTLLIHLKSGKKECVLPARCVFDSMEKARAVAAMKP